MMSGSGVRHVLHVTFLLIGAGVFIVLWGVSTLITPVSAQSDLRDYTILGIALSVPRAGKFWQAGDGAAKLNANFVSAAKPSDPTALSQFTNQLAQDAFAVWVDASLHNGFYTSVRFYKCQLRPEDIGYS